MSRGLTERLGGLVGALLLLSAAGLGQIVENPAKPKAANAGRVITPQQVAVISDEGTSDFYFSWPRELAAGPDGVLLLTDDAQVLMFDGNGKFLLNLFRKGQGPGETEWPGTALVARTNIVVYSGSPKKLVFYDRSGIYEKEITLRSEGRSLGWKLLGCQAGRIYFETGQFPRTAGDPDVVDNTRTILEVDASTGTARTLGTFVTRAWVVTSPAGGGGMFSITNIISRPFKNNLLAIAHTEDYLIKIYDPAADKIVRQFRRAYERVKGLPLSEAEKKGGIVIGDKHYTRPERKFENDVKNLLVRDGEIWAVTSTRDRDKGVLVDIFDEQGVYRDAFYLKLPESALGSLQSPGQCVLDGEFLWVVEKAEDETSTIKKYRVPR